MSGRANTTAVANEVVTFFANTLSIDKHFIGVAAGDAQTKAIDESSVASARFGNLIIGRVKDTSSTGAISHFPKVRQADTFFETNIEDVVTTTRHTTNTKALIINFIPVALSTDATNGVVANFATAQTIAENFIDSTSSNTVTNSVESEARRAHTSLSGSVIGSIYSTFSAYTLDLEVAWSTLANTNEDVVDFVCVAWNSAYS